MPIKKIQVLDLSPMILGFVAAVLNYVLNIHCEYVSQQAI